MNKSKIKYLTWYIIKNSESLMSLATLQDLLADFIADTETGLKSQLDSDSVNISSCLGSEFYNVGQISFFLLKQKARRSSNISSVVHTASKNICNLKEIYL